MRKGPETLKKLDLFKEEKGGQYAKEEETRSESGPGPNVSGTTGRGHCECNRMTVEVFKQGTDTI